MTDSSIRVPAADRRAAAPWLHPWDKPHAASTQAAPARGRAPPPREGLRPGALAPWWRAAGRALAFRPPGELAHLQAGAAVMVALVVANLLMNLLWQRLAIPGPATFHPTSLARGWLDMAVLAWLCVWLRPPVGAARLLCLVLGAEFVHMLVMGPLWTLLAATGLLSAAGWLAWLLWAGAQLWWLAAVALLFWRLGDGHRRAWLVSAIVLAALLALQWVVRPYPVWTADEPAGEAVPEDEPPVLALTEPVLQAQATLLDAKLAALRPQRPGVVDLYVLTFAPFGEEDVFRRESAMVAEVMGRRFDAQGRTLQLVNHPATAEQLPWATSANLGQALQRLARIMDPAEDVLFIHLTSHGAREGRLASALWPLQVEPLTPAALNAALQAAGIRHRVLSISACYSGSWIPELAGPGTLVMTAADAQHTSYGCGRRSALTFFGRAMYDEQLRTRTRSFAQAHEAAREVIRQREVEAGKDDGYSNPQIRMGAAIAPVLEALERRLPAD